MTVSPEKRRDDLLVLVFTAAVAFVLARAHVQNVNLRWTEARHALHEVTLENRAPDPYEYKFFAITWAIEGIHRATGIPVDRIESANTYLAILLLVLAHHSWIASLFGRRAGVVGTLFLAGFAHVFFLDYAYHPGELWGVAGYCLLLAAVVRGRGTPTLALLALATGLVWEKHALVPLLWAYWTWRRGRPLIPSALRGLLVLACALGWPVAVRLLLGGRRAVVDETTLRAEPWRRVLAHHLPVLVPSLLALVLFWRRVPAWVRLLWLTVPLLFLAYVLDRLRLDELRSFWAFVPVFTATLVAWLHPVDEGRACVAA